MDIFLVICAIILLFYALLWYYIKRTVWCRSQTCLVGKTTIVTGSNTGIGYETAVDFAKRGARVILACRDKEKAESAKKQIIEETKNSNVDVKILNLASFDSVRAFAKEIKSTEERLDILVNNAGIADVGDSKSEDGLLLVFQVNYLSHFLLTNLLIDFMKKLAPSRIINVSSAAAEYASNDLENFNKRISDYKDYAYSKLCLIFFTRELAKRLDKTNVSVYSVHPGAVETSIFRNCSGYNKMTIDWLKDNVLKTSEEGAQTSIHVAVTKDIEEFNGEHFENCEKVDPFKIVNVPEISQTLWEKSEIFVELKPEEKLL